jgi:hypothetical protein
VFPAAATETVTILGDGKPLATFTTSPFRHTWRGVAAGKHVVAIRAVDAGGRVTEQSEIVTVK